ncbi:MAG: peptidoglycan DD-metalloendopeptidase family protein [Propionibacteriaceae bacterium]|jgi:murein DD-endopeptidase MepM/ murein hydrolase activator NlpD|nr:peptidoglycan DD-metalloendopeptidase family protein [Propionibacteriaceae bacterium]
MRKILLALSALALVAFGPASAAEAATVLPPGVAPHDGAIVREFDPPGQPWLPGHRGVDFAGSVGDVVVAAASGTVTVAKPVAGRPVVTIDHGGGLSTTYEPVQALVQEGDKVFPGDTIGTLQSGHACPATACLHWGLREGSTYLDPRSLLASSDVWLISSAAFGDLKVQRAAWEQMLKEKEQAEARAGLLRPVDGPLTSPFGQRINPIGGFDEPHDGADLGSPCGTPIRAAAGGQIVRQGWADGFGNQVQIDHGTVGGRHLKTGYNHMSGYALSNGATVARGDVIGYIGTTGYSTGCHLHWHVWVNGQATDPMPLVGT